MIIVNTARGGLIDETALLEAVRSGQVASACLDSFAVEPMTVPHPFHGEKRITPSPHIGGVTADAYVKMGVAAARNALAVERNLQTVRPCHAWGACLGGFASTRRTRRHRGHGGNRSVKQEDNVC